jgi:hypothetical protein
MFSASTKSGKNPTGGGADPQFNYVTMLLHGDGTNGAQNNTFLDSSSNTFSITRNGNTTQGSFSPYGSNWSNYFNGSSYFETTSSQIVPTGSFTVECLVYVNTTASQAFVAQGTSGNAARFSLAIDGGYFWAQIGSATINNGLAIANTWTYLAATFNGGTLTLYVNGTSVGSVSTTTSAQNTTLAIGNYGSSWTTSYYVNGYISNVRISNTVRTIATPTAPYTIDANTNALFCQSNRFIDASASNYPINVIAGTPSVQRFNPFGTSTAYSTSVIGGSGYFDGDGDYLSVAYNSAFNYSSSIPFTIDFWFYPTVGGVDTAHIASCSNGVNDPNLNWLIRQKVDNTLRFVSIMSGAIANDSIDTFKLNQWNYAAIVMTGSAIKLWLNGVYQSSVSCNGSQQVNGYINVGYWQTYYTGYIANFRYTNTQVYTGTSNITLPTAPLTAVTGTQLLTNFTNGAIFDNAMMNNLETVGNAQISTSVVKYGTGSLAFDGTGDSLLSTGTQNAVFGTGDFTVEMWIYPNTTSPTYQGVIDTRPSGGASTNAFLVYITSASSGTLFYYSAGTHILSYSPISTSTWTHIAVTRSSGSLRLFINGTISGSAVSNTTNLTQTGIIIGNTFDGYGLNGNIDDIRITKGYARYTANFTPPSQAFSNIGPY